MGPDRKAPATSALIRRAAAALAAAWACAGSAAAEVPIPTGVPVTPPAPSPCTSVPAGAALQALLDAAPDGGSLCLARGVYFGPIRVERGLTVWGPVDAVIRTNGEGTTVRLAGAGPALLGVTVEGSGGRYDLEDAAVHVHGEGARVEGVTVRGAIFGLVVERSRDVTVRGNRIYGTERQTLGLRGDAIRFWETYDSRIEGNVVTDSRDIVVWYASRNRVVGNTVTGSRYGTHFMYSHGNLIEGNRYDGNVVGLFAMYSRDLTIRRNRMVDAAGAAGIGIGLKESSGLAIVENVFVHDTVGLYVDRSPYLPDSPNRIERNVFRLCETAVVFHSSPSDNFFVGNSFRSNLEQVRVDGGGDATGIEWRGNDYDDYAGYDFDRDGVGDIPYELRRLSNQLASTYPSLAFLHGTPALWLVDAISHIVPIFRPRTLVIDPAPRMRPLALGELLEDRA